jgi:hypothetical protein
MKADMQRNPKSGWFGTFEYEKGVDAALKPCPFCGEAEDFSVFGVSENAHYWVRCETCCSESGSHDVPDVLVTTQTFKTRAAFEAAHREGFERGIAAWNRRA